MKVSISKSVGRAFKVLELFREIPRPASATEIRRKLDCPHSSAVAVLQNLADLGYLSFDPATRLFFPTAKLTSLGKSLQTGISGAGKLGKLAESIAFGTGHTTVITSRLSIFQNVVLIRNGHPRRPVNVSSGPGLPLARTLPGLAILSQLEDDKIAETVAATNTWLQKTHAIYKCDLHGVMASVEQIRSSGAAAGLEHPGSREQVVTYPLASLTDYAPIAISVIGPRETVQPHTTSIRRVIEHYLGINAASPMPIMARMSAGSPAPFSAGVR